MKQYLPLGIQTFREIMSRQLLFFDKTEAFFNAIEEGKYYFLSRPHRFGKSLTFSTIKELYEGSKELFKGLWGEKYWNWDKKHLTIHFSFSNIGYKELGLETKLY